MESILERKNWEDYLIRLYFGAGKNDDILSLCIDRAYRDFNRTLHGIEKISNKEALHSQVTDTLKIAFMELKTREEKPNSQDEFDDWHKELCIKLKEQYNKNNYSKFSIGQAQKWINMSFKYIFCMGEDRLSGFSDFYKLCHVPIDNIILDKIIALGAPRLKCPWSRLDDYSEYLTLQKWFRNKPNSPLDIEFELWMKGDKISPKDNFKPISSKHPDKPVISTCANGDFLGPYDRETIILCSADASPNSQSDHSCAAEFFFPKAKWVGAIRNIAKIMDCKFTILTTKHGMVHPDDIIDKYDLEINGNENEIRTIWSNSIKNVLADGRYKLIVFYAGGCPRDQYLRILEPIFKEHKIDILTIGKPNMCDVGKVSDMVSMLANRVSIDQLKSVLEYPDRLLFFRYSITS